MQLITDSSACHIYFFTRRQMDRFINQLNTQLVLIKKTTYIHKWLVDSEITSLVISVRLARSKLDTGHLFV